VKYPRIGVALTALVISAGFVLACGLWGGSPTASFKAYFEAARKKDIAGMKKYMSKGTLDMTEKNAKTQGKSLDEALQNQSDISAKSSETNPETRNEKITGDTATLEIKTENNGEWITMPFVKEDGTWKIALDKFVEDLMNKIKDKTSKP
jgi:Tfp pilus assembly major pilin PilA